MIKIFTVSTCGREREREREREKEKEFSKFTSKNVPLSLSNEEIIEMFEETKDQALLMCNRLKKTDSAFSFMILTSSYFTAVEPQTN